MPSGLRPFPASPMLPPSVNEEYLHELAVPNGLFERLGIRHSVSGRGGDASMLPDELIPTPWISRDVHGDIMSIGSIFRFNDDQRTIKPEHNVWLGERHPWPKPALPSFRYGVLVATRGTSLQPESE